MRTFSPKDGATVLNTHWFTNPLEHWLTGLVTEIAAFGAFLLVVWLLAVLLMWAL